MNLFTTNQKIQLVDSTKEAKIPTPLGDVIFTCEANNNAITKMSPSQIISLQSGEIITSWISDEYIIEFLNFNFTPTLPIELKVEKCTASFWRVKALKDLNVNFKCYLNANIKCSPESGENLIAASFENNFYNLSIGTEDEESVNNRATSNYWFPSRLEIKPNHINYLSNGIDILLPTLIKSEQIQIQFIVALSSKANPEISTWYAVDQSPRNLLEKANVF
jgi:hypothetical protein